MSPDFFLSESGCKNKYIFVNSKTYANFFAFLKYKKTQINAIFLFESSFMWKIVCIFVPIFRGRKVLRTQKNALKRNFVLLGGGSFFGLKLEESKKVLPIKPFFRIYNNKVI